MLVLFGSREEWLAGRRRGIGSSDASILWGCGYKGCSLLTLFADKAEGVQVDVDWNTSVLMNMGKAAEPLIREWFERETGIRIATDPENSLRSCVEYPFMQASLDGYTVDSDENFVVVELKRVGRYARKEWGDDGVPLKYAVQLQHQLIVTGATYGYVVAMCDDRELLVRRCSRDDEFAAAHVAKCRWFWDMVVAKEYTGPVDGGTGSTDAIARLSPTATAGKSVDLGVEADDLADRISRLRDAIAEAQEEMDGAKNRLKLLMSDAEYGRSPSGRLVSYKNKNARGYYVPAKQYRELRIKENDE